MYEKRESEKRFTDLWIYFQFVPFQDFSLLSRRDGVIVVCDSMMILYICN